MVNYKHRAVLSSYSDLSKIPSDVKIIHFRKFVSKKLLKLVFEKCPKLEKITFSRYASKRIPKKIVPIIIEIYSVRGRPNILRYPDGSVEKLSCKQKIESSDLLRLRRII